MKRKLRFSILMLLMAVCGAANAQIWQEDFSSYKNNDVPSGGTYNYVCQNGKSDTKIYALAAPPKMLAHLLKYDSTVMESSPAVTVSARAYFPCVESYFNK